MSGGTRTLTVEEFLKIPDAKEGHNELHHGEIVVMPPPKLGHQRLQNRLQHLVPRVLGEEYVVYMEMAFRPGREHEVWQADVGCISRDRTEATGDDEYLMGAPNLVIEVLSPGNTVDEMNEKMGICMANGCQSFWTVDAKRKSISVTEGGVTRHFGLADCISCSLLKAELWVREIFEAEGR